MFELNEKQLNSIEDWKRIEINENIHLNQTNWNFDEENVETNETRAWSKYQTNNRENLFEQTPKRRSRSKEDDNGIEQILHFIDKRRPQRRQKLRFSFRLFLGTMSEILDNLNNRKSFGDLEEYRLIAIYIDSVFRGISQVMFANNPLTGLIIMIGLLIGNWQTALYGLFGTCVSTLTAYLFHVNLNSIQSGLFGYNGCLIGMGISYFSFSNSPQLIFPILFLCIFSTFFSLAIGRILVERLEIPPFTFSFQVSVWIWLLASYRSRYFFIDGNILSPSLLITYKDKDNLSDTSYQTYSVQDQFRGFFTGIAQVYFIDSPYTGAIILVGVCFCSRILSFFALFGSLTGQLTASYFLGVSPQSIMSGLWGFNSVLTCQALGGMFFVLNGYVMWIIVFYSSIMTVIIQSSLSSYLNSCGMPTLTFPFTFVCWIFCLIGQSKYMISIELSRVSIPEDHRKRYKMSTFFRNQFQSLEFLKYLNLSTSDKFTWEEYVEIEKLFLPILINSYIYQNNFTELKKFYKINRNIFNYFDENNRSSLHLSVSTGNFKITKWLIEKVGLNPNLKDKFDQTPLSDALINGHFHLLSYLYEHGARFSSSKSPEYAFILNAFVFEKNLFGIDLLISLGVNPNSCDYQRRTPLHIAVMNNQIDMVQYLIETYPIWLDSKDFSNRTPLDYAIQLKYSTISNYLFEKLQTNPMAMISNKDQKRFRETFPEEKQEESIGKNINHLYPFLFNMIFIQNNSLLFKEFLNDNQQIEIFDSIDYDYRTVVHYAANQGHLKIFEYLSENYSIEDFIKILFQEDRWNRSAIDQIFLNNHFHLIDFLNEFFSNKQIEFPSNEIQSTRNPLEKWEKIYLFHNLASSGQSQRIEHLFQRKYFLSNQFYHDYHYRTPAHYAAANGHINVIQVLLKYDFIGLFHSDRWGLTPFHHAKLNHFKSIQQLLTLTKF